MKEFRQAQSGWALRWGELAAGFYYRFPQHPFAQNARMAQLAALQAARAFGEKLTETRCDEIERLLARANLSEDERFNLRWECMIRSAVSKLDSSQDQMIEELEQAARSLQRDFPSKPDSQALLAEKHVPKNQARQRFLDMDLQTIDGKKYKLRDLKGKVVLLHFWTTTTSPDGLHFDQLKKVAEKYRGDALEIISINFDSLESGRGTALERESPSWPQVFHSNRSSHTPWRDYGIEYLPANWVLDQNGVLRDQHAGMGILAKLEGLLRRP